MMKTMQSPEPFLTELEGSALVRLARKSIMEKFGVKLDKAEADHLAAALRSESLQARHGTFVTLKKDGQLRGCIGNLTSSESVVKGVKSNAINAAFHDPRFSPLQQGELDKIHIEVSVLNDPKPLDYQDGRELAGKLRSGVDGVIIRKDLYSATFLPQVWEQLPAPDSFLSHLCLKAGLPATAWQSAKLEVLTYQVQYFTEQ